MNALARLVEEQGVTRSAKLFARVLQERFAPSDPMASTVADHLMMGVTRAEAEAS